MHTPLRFQKVAGRIYRISLFCYPRSHRVRFGAEMAQLFSDLCQEVYRREGTAGLVGLWLASLADLLKSALEMRWSEALGRWRFLPIVPGLLLPATFGIGVELAVQVIVMFLAASLILLGYVVQRPATRQAAATV